MIRKNEQFEIRIQKSSKNVANRKFRFENISKIKHIEETDSKTIIIAASFAQSYTRDVRKTIVHFHKRQKKTIDLQANMILLIRFTRLDFENIVS